MFEQALKDLDVDEFWRNGYALLPNAYSAEEIEKMRNDVHEHMKVGGDLAGGPLEYALTDGRMASVARKLLNTEEVIYGGDSSATINGKIRVWHKDNTDRLDADAPDWDDEYTQLRFGVYLQDHTEHTGGLNLKVGSHHECNHTVGKTIYVRNRPGDMLVWSMRMTHSGAGTLLKDPNAPRDPEPNEWNAFPEDEVAPAHDERMAVFVHLGADDKHGRRYLDYLRTRTYMVRAWRRRPFTPETIKALEAAGLNVRNLPAEVKDDPRAGLSEQWAPYPYQRNKDNPGTWAVAGQVPAPKAAPKPAAAPAPAAKPAAAPAPAPKPAAGPRPSDDFVPRYSRAVKRRLRGVAKGAKTGWSSAAPTGRR